MKLVTCKRCDAKNVYWFQGHNGKWILKNSEDGQLHVCEDGKLKAVKCKYCNADDLHWAEEVNPQNQTKKMVLTESYGLPHACDERIAFVAKEKQQKKDKYEAEKQRILAHPEGKCPQCSGNGYGNTGSLMNNPYARCASCYGYGYFSEKSKKDMLSIKRREIWPNMKDYSYRYR